MYEELRHNFGIGDGKSTACVNSLAYLIYAEQKGIPREDALANLTVVDKRTARAAQKVAQES